MTGVETAAPAMDAGPESDMQDAQSATLDAQLVSPNPNVPEYDANVMPERGGVLDAGHSADDGSVASVDGFDVRTVVIDLRNQQMGTILLPVPYPVVLFRDGTACASSRVVIDGLDLVAHRSMFPRLWTEWRGMQGGIELRKGMSWTRLRYQGEYPPLAKGTVFQGTYVYTSGSYFGVANGLAQRTYRFASDGSFAVDRSALLVTESGGAAGVSVSPSESGQYEIDGYIIRFHYRDGTRSSAAIVHGPADPKVIYINDAAFLKS